LPEIYIPLKLAAELEEIKYNTLLQRILRNPKDFKTRKVPGENGGKEQVEIALSSLSSKARKAYKAAEKLDGSDVIIEQKTNEAPWYLDIDLNGYIEGHKQDYYEAVELAKQIELFTNYAKSEKTAHAAETAAALGMSQRTLYRNAEVYLEAGAWAAKLKKEEDRDCNYFKILALCRKPKDANTFPSLNEQQKAFIENIWFNKDFAANRGTREMLYWKMVDSADAHGWDEFPSIKTVDRYIAFLINERGGKNAHYYAENGLREFKNKKMLKGKRDTTALAVMEFVQGDEHTFDCWVQLTSTNGKIKAVRPKLVAWLDTRTRCIMGDVLCVDANSQILKESLVKMIYSHPGGVPKHLHIDNGKDYTSKTNTGQSRTERTMQVLEFDSETRGFYRSIGIDEWSRSLPYEPWGKGQIERFFGTVCSMFTKWMDSYVGTLTGSKTAGKVKKDIPKMLERGELLTMEEFFELWSKWKNEFYHKREHSSLRKDREKHITPISLFENAEERYIKASPPREYAAIMLMNADKALVRNQGIMKFGTLYTDYELCHYIGETVGVKWDLNDVTKLYVYDRSGKKICEAVSAELLQFAPGVSQAALETHIRNQKRQIRETQELLAEFRTPYELRGQNDGGTPMVVGGLDLTVKNDARNEKVVQLPDDKEYRAEAKAAAKDKKSKPKTAKIQQDEEIRTIDPWMQKKADEAYEIIRNLS